MCITVKNSITVYIKYMLKYIQHCMDVCACVRQRFVYICFSLSVLLSSSLSPSLLPPISLYPPLSFPLSLSLSPLSFSLSPSPFLLFSLSHFSVKSSLLPSCTLFIL